MMIIRSANHHVVATGRVSDYGCIGKTNKNGTFVYKFAENIKKAEWSNLFHALNNMFSCKEENYNLQFEEHRNRGKHIRHAAIQRIQDD